MKKMWKKCAALGLTAAMMMSMSVGAFAAEPAGAVKAASGQAVLAESWYSADDQAAELLDQKMVAQEIEDAVPMAAGLYVTYQRESEDDLVYFKYTSSVNGYITIADNAEDGFYISMYNKNGKQMKEATYGDADNAATFVVKQGTTYYFAIGVISLNEDGQHVIYSEETALGKKLTGGASKAAASTLKQGKIQYNILDYGGAAKWYKFNNPKYQKVKFEFDMLVNDGAFKVSVYTSSGKLVGSKTVTTPENLILTYSTVNNYVMKGTYYVKVARANGKTSGVYSIKWK